MESKALKDLCFPDRCGIYGIPASAEEFDLSKTRYLRISDISEDGILSNADKKSVSNSQIDKYLLEEGDIVFARTGNSTGKSYFHEAKNGELAFAGFLIKFSLDPSKVNPKYIRYYTITNHYRQWVENFSLGSTRGNLNANSFGNCPIPLPSRKQQNLLVKVLSDLDAKIEVNNQINAKLEALAKTLYEYWFVQFDFPSPPTPERGEKEGKPYKSSGGKLVYNKELKREIPEGWGVKSLVDIANFKNGIACQKYRPVEADKYLNVIKIREMRDGFTSNTERVRDDLSNDIIINDGDILFSWSASLIVQIWAGGKGALNQHIFKVTYDSYPRSLVYFETLEYLKYFQRVAELRKTTMGHITKEHLVASRICVPPKNKLDDCLNQIDKILDKIVINKKQNQKLADLRDWLLPMLMNGQITINETKEYVSSDHSELGMVAERKEKYGEI